MFLFRRSTQINLERYDGFNTQAKYDCDGSLKTLFFELQRSIDDFFIEYMKPFGYPVKLSGNIVEIQRDNFFRLMLPQNRTAFHAEFYRSSTPKTQNLLIQQVYRGVHRIIRTNLAEKCPEKAIEIIDDRFSINLSKCTYCLECVE